MKHDVLDVLSQSMQLVMRPETVVPKGPEEDPASLLLD